MSPGGVVAGIEERISQNKIVTVLLGVVAALNVGIIIWLIGALSRSATATLVAVGIVVVWVLCAYFFFEATVLRSTGARPMTPADERYLLPIVTPLAAMLGIPMPRVQVIDDPAPNAFAVGTGGRATVVFSTGLIGLLTYDELEGVAAHELSHIANGDTRLANYSAALLGWAVFVSVAVTVVAIGFGFGGVGMMTGGGDRDEDWTAVLARICVGIGIICAAIAAWVVAQAWFLISRITHLGISRQREWIADASAARATGKPLALASALEKLLGYDTTLHHGKMVAQALCIAGAPKSDRWWEDLFSTHPDTIERIARLRSFATYVEKE